MGKLREQTEQLIADISDAIDNVDLGDADANANAHAGSGSGEDEDDQLASLSERLVELEDELKELEEEKLVLRATEV